MKLWPELSKEVRQGWPFKNLTIVSSYHELLLSIMKFCIQIQPHNSSRCYNFISFQQSEKRTLSDLSYEKSKIFQNKKSKQFAYKVIRNEIQAHKNKLNNDSKDTTKKDSRHQMTFKIYDSYGLPDIITWNFHINWHLLEF